MCPPWTSTAGGALRGGLAVLEPPRPKAAVPSLWALGRGCGGQRGSFWKLGRLHKGTPVLGLFRMSKSWLWKQGGERYSRGLKE